MRDLLLFLFFFSLTRLIVYKMVINCSRWSFFFYSTICQRCFIPWSFSQRSLKSCFILIAVSAHFFFDINGRFFNYFTAIFLSFFQHKRQYLVHRSLRLPAKKVIRVCGEMTVHAWNRKLNSSISPRRPRVIKKMVCIAAIQERNTWQKHTY